MICLKDEHVDDIEFTLNKIVQQGGEECLRAECCLEHIARARRAYPPSAEGEPPKNN